MGKSDGEIDLTMSMNQEFFFNELSLEELPDDINVLDNLKACFGKLRESGFTICRIDHNQINKLLDYIPNISGVSVGTAKNYLLSRFRPPYEKEDMTDKEAESFLNVDLYYHGRNVAGLQWAYVYDTMALSLLTDEQWNTSTVILKDQVSGSEVPVHHAATEHNVIDQEQWIEALKDIELVKTDIVPGDKKYHVRDDHGSEKLEAFWKKLRNNDYVISCLNSLEFASHSKELIRNIFPDGKIEVTLHWDDAGYGMVIQTTGRNYWETKEIAEILKKDYDR